MCKRENWDRRNFTSGVPSSLARRPTTQYCGNLFSIPRQKKRLKHGQNLKIINSLSRSHNISILILPLQEFPPLRDSKGNHELATEEKTAERNCCKGLRFSKFQDKRDAKIFCSKAFSTSFFPIGTKVLIVIHSYLLWQWSNCTHLQAFSRASIYIVFTDIILSAIHLLFNDIKEFCFGKSMISSIGWFLFSGANHVHGIFSRATRSGPTLVLPFCQSITSRLVNYLV